MPRNVLGDESFKIDKRKTDGLLGEQNSLAYRVHEIERHVHSRERWMGLASSPVGETHRADLDSMTPFQVDAGNDTFGSWVQILGSEDTPIISGSVKLDIHRLLITEVETGKVITRIQIAYDSSAAAALAAGNFTEIMIIPEKATKENPFEIKFPRVLCGTKFWARCWASGQDTSTIDFFYGLHEYEG
jgi:hypothetical protein